MKHLKHFITGSPKNYTLDIAHGDMTQADGRSLNDYDREVTKWLNDDRKGPKPIRRVEKK